MRRIQHPLIVIIRQVEPAERIRRKAIWREIEQIWLAADLPAARADLLLLSRPQFAHKCGLLLGRIARHPERGCPTPFATADGLLALLRSLLTGDSEAAALRFAKLEESVDWAIHGFKRCKHLRSRR